MPDVAAADRAKALYRRALAEIALKDSDAAVTDLQEAHRLLPEDAAISQELKPLQKKKAEAERKEKAALQKFFS